jgi:hypothetical protein
MRDFGNCDQRLVAVLWRGADIERTCGRIRPDHQKIIACFKALVSRAGGQDRNVTRFQDERAPFGAAELDAAAAARDSEHFVDARVVMSIVVDAVAP